MRAVSIALCVATLILGGACTPADSQNETGKTAHAGTTEPAKLTAPAPLTHWDEFRFGMTFDDALTAAPGITWNAESFRTCRNTIPVKGCSLSPNPERSYRQTFAGMELLPSLDFNEDAKLTDVKMGRVYHAGVTAKQCEAMHVRLLDKLTTMFGKAHVQSEEDGSLLLRSPAGNAYRRSKEVSPVMVAGIERFRTASDGSDISLLTTFTAGSKYSEPACFIGFYVDGPKTLRRRPLEKVDVSSNDDDE